MQCMVGMFQFLPSPQGEEAGKCPEEGTHEAVP